MERRKHRESDLDELAIVKAAAWSWYQHGSGAEGRPMREYDLSRTQRLPKPSRYKLEAMRDDDYVQEQEEDHDYVQEQEEDHDLKQISFSTLMSSSSPLSSNYITAGENSENVSLLDTYEIERISRELHSYIESSRIKHLKSFLAGDDGNGRPGNRKVASLSESGTKEKRIRTKPMLKTSNGFWKVFCGSGHHDVVEAMVQGGRRISFKGYSRRQEMNVPVVKTFSSLRWGVHAE